MSPPLQQARCPQGLFWRVSQALASEDAGGHTARLGEGPGPGCWCCCGMSGGCSSCGEGPPHSRPGAGALWARRSAGIALRDRAVSISQ